MTSGRVGRPCFGLAVDRPAAALLGSLVMVISLVTSRWMPRVPDTLVEPGVGGGGGRGCSRFPAAAGAGAGAARGAGDAADTRVSSEEASAGSRQEPLGCDTAERLTICKNRSNWPVISGMAPAPIGRRPGKGARLRRPLDPGDTADTVEGADAGNVPGAGNRAAPAAAGPETLAGATLPEDETAARAEEAPDTETAAAAGALDAGTAATAAEVAPGGVATAETGTLVTDTPSVLATDSAQPGPTCGVGGAWLVG